YGTLLVATGRPDEALEHFAQAIEYDPRNANLHRRRARLYFDLADFGKSLEDITAATALSPGDLANVVSIPPPDFAACPDANFRAGILILAGKTIERLNGSAAAYLARASLHVAMRDFTAAQQDYESAASAYGLSDDRARSDLAAARNNCAW